ncbi:MAG: hypothetical protein MJ181_08920 [Treponema sp.]|nr:hypothetical protein [Treponema sp.]
MKKFFGILFTCLVFASCKNFLSDNQSILDKLREEVKVNTAPEIAGVTFSQPKSIDGSSQIGTISLVGNASVLVDVKFRIELEINPKDGYFNEWQAFLRDKDGLKPVEGTDLIEFTQINTNPADVVIKKQVDNLVIGAKINYTPSVSIASPDYGTSSISGVAKMLDGETLPVVFNSEQYGLSVFKISYRDMANSAIQSFDLKEMPEYTEKLELKKEDGTLLYTLHNFRINKSLSNLSFVIEPADTLDDIYSLSVDTEKRSEIRETDPINGKEGLMRTTPIKIRFSSDMDCSQITEENFRDYVTVERVVIDETTSEETLYDCFADEGNKLDENRTRCYFNIPEFASDKKTLLITPQNKTKESEWLPSGSTIRVTVKDNLRNQEGIPLLQDHTFSFSLGTKGDAEGPIITKDKTKLSIYSSRKNIDQSEWGDFEPAKNPVMGHTYADSIHVGPREKFKVNIQATDVNTGDTGIKDFVADIRLMYVYEGGRLPNSSEKASKNLILFDKDGNWLYEAGCLKQDFNKEYTVPYTGTNKMAETDSNFLIDFEDFKTEDSLSVDGIYRIELTARDMLENYASNSNVYYVVRDTTPPDPEKNVQNIILSTKKDSGTINNGKVYFSQNSKSVSFDFAGSIEDSGTQGQPKLACNKTDNYWQIAFSYSNEILDETTIIGTWSAFKKAEEIISLEIPTEVFDSDKEIYVWTKFKDGNGFLSKEICVSDIPLYIDITEPTISILSNDDDYFYFKTVENENSIYLKNYNSYVNFEIYDQIHSGISSGLKTVYIGLENSETKDLVENNKYNFTSNGVYNVEAYDYAGNKSSLLVDVSIIDESSIPEFNASHVVNKELTDGNFEFTLEISDNSIGLQDNGIEFTNFIVEKYEIRNSMDEVIQKGDSQNTAFIPVKRINTRGDIFIDVSGKIDVTKYPERFFDDEPNILSYFVDNGYSRKENNIPFYLDVTPPVFKISNSRNFSVAPVLVETDGNYEMYFYNTSSGSPFIYIEDNSTWKFSYKKLPDGVKSSVYTYNSQTQYSDFFYDVDYEIYLSDAAGNESNFILHKIRDNSAPTFNFENCIVDDDVLYYYSERFDGVKVVVSDNDFVDHCFVTNGDNIDYKTSPEFYLTGSKEGITYKLKAVDRANLVSEKTVKVISESAEDFKCEITGVLASVKYIDAEGKLASKLKKFGVNEMIPCSLGRIYYNINCSENGSGLAENGIDILYYYSANQSGIVTQTVNNVEVDEKTTTLNDQYFPVTQEISHINNAIVLRIKNRYGDYFYSVLDSPIDAYPPKPVITSQKDYILVTQTSDEYHYEIRNFDWQKDMEFVVDAIDRHAIGLNADADGSGVLDYFELQSVTTVNKETKYSTLNLPDTSLKSTVNLHGFGVNDTRRYNLFLYDNLGNESKRNNGNKPVTWIVCTTIPSKKTYSFTDSESRPEFEGNWFVDNGVLRSPTIGDSEETIETITLNNCNGFKFKYKVSSEKNYDYFVCFLDGEPIIGNVSGSDMTEFVEFKKYYEKSGNHILEFKYHKDGSQSKGDDCVYIDDFIIY